MNGEPESGRQATGDSAMTGVILVVAALTVVLVAVATTGYLVGHDSRSSSSSPPTTAGSTVPSQAVDPAVAAGARDYVDFGCVQCHGEGGQGGVDPAVPALTGATSLTADQLRTLINKGAGLSDNPTQPFMPVWHDIVSDHQVNDLVAYIHAGLPAVPGAQPQLVPQDQGDVVAGQVLYSNYGCINCHGPNGLGGVPNPLSEDKTIPPLSGADFRSEFNTPQKIADVIRSGSVLGKPPITSMPHWGGILSDQQIAQLIAYIDSLK